MAHMELSELARRLSDVRAQRRLTLNELARRSGVSTSMLSAVERARRAPTILVLARIADGLEIPLERLVADSAQPRVVVRRAGDQEVTEHPAGWSRAILSPVVAGVNVELIRSSLPARCEAGTFPAYATGSHEFVAVETGELRMDIDDESFDLGPGDSIYFAADATHAYSNQSDVPCVYYIAALIMRARQ
jgi:transcriptional regulator with XRE-family HTH domain